MKTLKNPYDLAGRLLAVTGSIIVVLVLTMESIETQAQRGLAFLGLVCILMGMGLFVYGRKDSKKLRRLQKTGRSYHGTVTEAVDAHLGFKLSGLRVFRLLCSYQDQHGETQHVTSGLLCAMKHNPHIGHGSGNSSRLVVTVYASQTDGTDCAVHVGLPKA